jgi:hypothetical protein
MAVSKRLRFEILRRDNHACRYCGRSAPEVKLTVDHVVPETLGGSDDPSNLAAACADCNGGKSSVPADAATVADVASDAIRWARAMQQVAEIRAAERADRMEIKWWFGNIWSSWRDYNDEMYEVPDNALDSVVRFLDAGLTRDQLTDLVRIAMHSTSWEKFRYFCGCCWRRIRENTEMAADIIAAAETDGFDG